MSSHNFNDADHCFSNTGLGPSVWFTRIVARTATPKEYHIMYNICFQAFPCPYKCNLLRVIRGWLTNASHFVSYFTIVSIVWKRLQCWVLCPEELTVVSASLVCTDILLLYTPLHCWEGDSSFKITWCPAWRTTHVGYTPLSKHY